jgi:hypothetical protein
MFVARVLAVLLLAVPLAAQNTGQNGRYSQRGISFEVPAAWSYRGTIPAEAPPDETTRWMDPQTGINFYAWTSRRPVAPESIATLMAEAVARKTQQRAREGYKAWRVRRESVRQITVGGHPGLFAIADYDSNGDGRPRVECLAWIFTPESRVLLFAFMRPEQRSTFQPQFEKILRSAVVP